MVRYVMAFSTNTFAVKYISVVFLPALNATLEGGISASSLSAIPFFMHTARTFLINEGSVRVLSAFQASVLALLYQLSILGDATLFLICFCRYQLPVRGAYLVQISISQLLLFCSDLIALFISFAVNGWFIAVGCEWILFNT